MHVSGLPAKNLARSCGQARSDPCSATQSSVYAANWYPAANDGNRDVNSWASTDFQLNPWWSVDFGRSRKIVSATIWNRGDCCQSRLDGFRIWIGDNATYDGQGNTNCYTATTTSHYSSPFTHSFTCVGRGRYFFVQLPTSNYLSLAEVEVLESGFT
jgi:hypothetical protein